MPRSLYRQYLQQARQQARRDPRRPQQGNLRRAVSTAYYALFHFLIEKSSRLMVGSTTRREGLRRVLARAYGHSEMAAVARTFGGGTLPAVVGRNIGPMTVPPSLRLIAQRFVTLQDERHLADYDLSVAYARSAVLDLIDAVEQHIEGWSAVAHDPAAELFLVGLLVWDRVRNK